MLQGALEAGLFAMPSPSGEHHRVANVPMVLAAATQIASALKHLHAHNIIHSDLSLTNVLLAQPLPGSACSIHCKVRGLPHSGRCGDSRISRSPHFCCDMSMLAKAHSSL